MVDIYLKLGDDSDFIHFLSIPLSDIRRLSVRPLKWIRFVVFTICGSHGHLHETAAVNVPPVDYGILDLVESSTYYYIPDKYCTFIDQNALNERLTSSESVLTQRRRSFRRRIMQRDGKLCVFTHEVEGNCEAAHIIPRSKGDEYLAKVIQLRSHLYDHALVPAISGINDVQNGIFLNLILHAKFACGKIAFIKTPNFALNPDDIPRVAQDPTLPTPPNPIIMQHLVPQVAFYTYPDCLDAHFGGVVGDLLPPSILLDYMYGVAAYNRWRANTIHPVDVVDQSFSDNYKWIPLPPRSEPSGSDTSAMHEHHNSHRQGPRGGGLEEAMDKMNFFLMYINGITPQALAKKRQAEEEERQLLAQE